MFLEPAETWQPRSPVLCFYCAGGRGILCFWKDYFWPVREQQQLALQGATSSPHQLVQHLTGLPCFGDWGGEWVWRDLADKKRRTMASIHVTNRGDFTYFPEKYFLELAPHLLKRNSTKLAANVTLFLSNKSMKIRVTVFSVCLFACSHVFLTYLCTVIWISCAPSAGFHRVPKPLKLADGVWKKRVSQNTTKQRFLWIREAEEFHLFSIQLYLNPNKQ